MVAWPGAPPGIPRTRLGHCYRRVRDGRPDRQCRRPLRPADQPDRVRELEAWNAQDHLGRVRRGHVGDPGVRDGHQRQPRANRAVQGQDPGPVVPARHLSHGLLRRHGSAFHRQREPVGHAPAVAARVPHRSEHRPVRLLQLGCVSLLGGPRVRSVGHLLRKARPHRRHELAAATSCSSSATTRARRRVLFQTSDTTWQAYNAYGGNSLYTGSPAGRAYKVSYNRPFSTRVGHARGLGVQRRVSDGALARGQRLRRQLHDRRGQRPQRRADQEPQALHVRRARRVLVGRSAGERRGGTRRRRQPGVLQRQRGVLEDPLGERRRGRRLPDARLLQGDARQREDRPGRSSDLDGDLA